MIKTIRTVWLPLLVGMIFLTAGCTTLGKEAEYFSNDRIEQLVAPLALYPDTLLAQVLMAATYPLEVVLAARWVRQYPGLSGEKLQDALRDKSWDPSVKSLIAFPEVLERMETELQWMEDLGNAFLGYQSEVMDAVQRLRARAQTAGHLETTPQQNIVIKDRVIFIEPAQPEVIYVPTYNPTMVFSGWRQPTIYYPNLYVARPPVYRPQFQHETSGLLTFGLGVITGGILFSKFDWHRHNINVQPPRPTIYTQSTNYTQSTTFNNSVAPVTWQHDPIHRQGVRYHDSRLENHYREPKANRQSGLPAIEPPPPQKNNDNSSGRSSTSNLVEPNRLMRPGPHFPEVPRVPNSSAIPRATANSSERPTTGERLTPERLARPTPRERLTPERLARPTPRERLTPERLARPTPGERPTPDRLARPTPHFPEMPRGPHSSRAAPSDRDREASSQRSDIQRMSPERLARPLPNFSETSRGSQSSIAIPNDQQRTTASSRRSAFQSFQRPTPTSTSTMVAPERGSRPLQRLPETVRAIPRDRATASGRAELPRMSTATMERPARMAMPNRPYLPEAPPRVRPPIRNTSQPVSAQPQPTQESSRFSSPPKGEKKRDKKDISSE